MRRITNIRPILCYTVSFNCSENIIISLESAVESVVSFEMLYCIPRILKLSLCGHSNKFMWTQ